jgi:hypothetical protein
MNKTPIIGAGTDFTTSSNGYIASFLTDANDPALLNIPAGNFNFETYFEASSGGGSPTFYIELYKYDGTNFTLIASNSTSPKLINDGTNIEAYFSALAVPQTTLTLTDRLAIRIYVTTAGRTITLHTENGHLCQVITTFTTGLTALNGLTAQVQYLATGTSGTDFNIASASATHTFNLPTASATNRGALSSTDWTTFNNKQNALTNPITGISASGRVAYFNGDTSITGSSNFFWDATNNRLGIGLNNPQRTLEIHNATADSQLRISGAAPSVSLGEAITGAIYQAKFGLITANGQYVTGGVAGDFVMISQTGATIFATSSTEKMRVQASGNVSIGNTNDTHRLDVTGTGRFTGQLTLGSTITNGTNTYTLPSATGTLALTSDLGAYLPLLGGTMTGQIVLKESSSSTDFTKGLRFPNDPFGGSSDISGMRLYSSSSENMVLELYIGNDGPDDIINFATGVGGTANNDSVRINGNKIWNAGNLTPQTQLNGTGFVKASGTTISYDNSTYLTTSAASSTYLPLTGGTLTGALGGTSATFSSSVTATSGTFITSGSATNVLIGTTSTTGAITVSADRSNLVIGAAISNKIAFNNGSTTQTGYLFNSPTETALGYTGTFNLQIVGGGNILTATSGGNVGIGTTNPNSFNAGANQLVVGSGSTTQGITIFTSSTTDGNIYFANGTSGSSAYNGALGYNHSSNYMYFGTNGGAEKLRITSGGYLKASNTGVYVNSTGNSHEFVNYDPNFVTEFWNRNGTNPFGLRIRHGDISPNNTSNWFIYADDSGSTIRFNVRSNGGIANFQANDVNLSDERTKKDIQPLESYWDKFKAIEIVKFRYKDQTHDDFNIGVIAQQVESVAPEFVDVDGWGKPELDKEGNEIVSKEEPLKSIYTADLHHATIKVLQEAMAKIEDLQNQLDTLKNK